jgi:hypothetical protein
MRLLKIFLFVFVGVANNVQADVVFEGEPSVKIQITEGNTLTTTLSSAQAPTLRVKIIKVGDQYIWASRNNLPMVKTESGAYITYTAVTGAGYVRVVIPMLRKMIEAMPPAQREKEYVYMEHLVHTLGSITYFGR